MNETRAIPPSRAAVREHLRAPQTRRPRVGLLVTLGAVTVVVGFWTRPGDGGQPEAATAANQVVIRHDGVLEIRTLLEPDENGERFIADGEIGFGYRCPADAIDRAREAILDNWESATAQVTSAVARYRRSDLLVDTEAFNHDVHEALATSMFRHGEGEIVRVGWQRLALRAADAAAAQKR